MNVNNLALQILDEYFPLKISRRSFKYLYVIICQQLSDFYKNNLPPVINKL